MIGVGGPTPGLWPGLCENFGRQFRAAPLQRRTPVFIVIRSLTSQAMRRPRRTILVYTGSEDPPVGMYSVTARVYNRLAAPRHSDHGCPRGRPRSDESRALKLRERSWTRLELRLAAQSDAHNARDQGERGESDECTGIGTGDLLEKADQIGPEEATR
jgi:hypothetical protein